MSRRLKKCNPPNLFCLVELVNEAMFETLRVFVLVAKMHWLDAFESSILNKSCLTLGSSTIASITRSEDETASDGSVVVLILSNTEDTSSSCRVLSSGCVRFATRAMDCWIIDRPLSNAFSDESHSVTENPLYAATCTMPAPAQRRIMPLIHHRTQLYFE